jgi:type I restriction enzyme S subunit
MTTSTSLFPEPLPVGWTFDRLKDVVSLRSERSDDKSEIEDYLELEDLESGTGQVLGRRNTVEVVSSVTKFYAGDVLFGKLRPYLEKFYLAQFDGKCTGEILAFKPERIAGPFLYYCIASTGFTELCNMFSYGTKMPRVNWPTQLAHFVVPLPPLQEQTIIAAYLNASCAAVHAALKAKKAQIEAINTLKQAVAFRAVTCGIHGTHSLAVVERDWIVGLPARWEACRIKRILARMDYGISESTTDEGLYPVLKMGHLVDGEISYSNLDYVEDVCDELILETGDILYNRTNSPDQVGKAAVFRRDKTDAVTFASYLVRLRVNHRVDPYYLNYVLNCEGFLGYARRLAIPSVQQSNLNSTRYSGIFIPLPPLQEQQEIRAHLDEELGKLRKLQLNIEVQIETLQAYRKSLIHECVTGKRRVTDEDVKRVQSDASVPL